MLSSLIPRSLPPSVPSSPPRTLRSVAIIGAGAAGLAAARELRREGHGVVVFERGAEVGGTWIYNPTVESDPLGLDPERHVTHSSLYASLRTNLPREVMGFLDYPFVVRKNSEDSRRFPGHREVLRYLKDFARDFDLCGMIRLETEVVRLAIEGDGRWSVRSRKVGKDLDGGDHYEEEIYDGVVVCNGHYTEPRIAYIPGIDAWPGQQIHSHNYRVPCPFYDQVVVLIGSAASAHDISRDIAGVAKEVHVAARSAPAGTLVKQPGYDNMWLHSMIESAHEDGTLVFQDGSSAHADVIMHCTGYKYHFPFLDTKGIVTVDDNCVGPLYKHIFPPKLAPGLSFIGLPWKVVPFPLCELQSKWVAGVLSGRVTLPTQIEMMEDIKALHSEMEVNGLPKRYVHNIGNYQFEYDDWLATECGYSAVEEWRKFMYSECGKNKIARPESYRDDWNDDHLVAQAMEDFKKFL
ncbi:Flavin monooxygenase FMO protein [Dioscorea alata]|uniref:Flavin monooxygenase FMO protein n=1 Tax=Dioscorea alata TaxID=55571 RepID=A0ACB7WIG9_DIOAL|nr:Flavin monooxygenase FMO protein [Dioscorea alata]